MNFSIKDFFSNKGQKESQEGRVDKIQLATCAIFVEMAGIDGEFSDKERDVIITFLKDHYHLEDSSARELIFLAKEEIEGSLDMWHFTNCINKSYSREDKMKIIKMVWTIIYADKKLDAYEDYLVHKLSTLLNLSHKELITAKLSVLKKE